MSPRTLRSHPFPLLRLSGTVLILLACAAMLALALGLSTAFAWRDRERSYRQARDIAGNLSLLVAEHAARLVETGDLVLRQAVRMADGAAPDSRATWTDYVALARAAPYVEAIRLFDASGREVLTTRRFPVPTVDASAAEWFRAHKGGVGDGPVKGVFIGRRSAAPPDGGEPRIVLSRALPAGPDGFRGVVALEITPHYPRDIERAFDFGYAHRITLRSSSGAILLREIQGRDAAAGADAAAVTPTLPEIAVRRQADGTGLLAEVAIPLSAVTARWHHRLWTYGAYGLMALATVLLFGALAIYRTRREQEAEEALQIAYDTLEDRVHRRTAELEEANAQLAAAVTDKEVLLKEVQHRVKNNLQVICSLLRLQGARLDDSSRRAFDESLRRIQSMSLLQELLYRSEQPAHIDLAEFLRRLSDGLVRSGNPTGARLVVEAEPWTVDVDQATPLALIASELVSNALLHAFPDGRTGTVTVVLAAVAGEGAMRLCVRDDGVGLPPGLPDPRQRRGGGLGLVLVQTLSRQAGGQLSVERGAEVEGGGTAFTLTVPITGARNRKAA